MPFHGDPTFVATSPSPLIIARYRFTNYASSLTILYDRFIGIYIAVAGYSGGHAASISIHVTLKFRGGAFFNIDRGY
jgi:hypothetical protein